MIFLVTICFGQIASQKTDNESPTMADSKKITRETIPSVSQNSDALAKTAEELKAWEMIMNALEESDTTESVRSNEYDRKGNGKGKSEGDRRGPKERPKGWDKGQKKGWNGKDVPPGLQKNHRGKAKGKGN